jgi:hypothetical protein
MKARLDFFKSAPEAMKSLIALDRSLIFKAIG